MNKQNLINNWKVIKALKKGKDIQYFDTDNRVWLDTDNIDNIEVVRHRVKPKSKENIDVTKTNTATNKVIIINLHEAVLAKQASISVEYKYPQDVVWTVLTKKEIDVFKILDTESMPLLRIHPSFVDIWPKHYEYIKAWLKDSKSIQTKFADESDWYFIDGIPEYLPELEIRYNPHYLKPTYVNSELFDDLQPEKLDSKTEYVPFTKKTALEHSILGKTIKSKDNKIYTIITCINDKGIYIGPYFYSYEHLFEYYIFVDNTPFGVPVQP